MRDFFEFFTWFACIILIISVFLGICYGIAYWGTSSSCSDWRVQTGLETKQSGTSCYVKIGDEWAHKHHVVKILRDGKLVWDIDRK